MDFKELIQRIYYFDHFNQFGKRDLTQHQANKEKLREQILDQNLTEIQKEKILMECGKLFNEQYKWALGAYPNNTKKQKLWNEGTGPELKSVIKGYLK